MVETEQYFPRGGKKPKPQFTERKKFDFLGNADRIGKKRKYRGPKINLEEEEERSGYVSDASSGSGDDGAAIKSVTAEGISMKTIQEGMVILGRVMQIYDTKIIVSLPGKLFGTVMASHISLPYTNLLKSFVDGDTEDIKKPEDLFHIGEYVTVKVTSKTAGEEKNIIGLSLMPQDVNSGTYFSALKEGMLLRSAVSAVEDHGYVLDLGIANARSFMPKKLTDDSLPLDIGQVIWCNVKKCQTTGTNAIVTLTNSLEVINSSSISGNALQNYSVNNLKPGMALGFSVSKPLPDGAEGFILQNSLGYIHTSQIGSKIKMGQKVNARVLYIMPVSKLPFLTTRKIFEDYKPNLEEEGHFKIGDVCENAKVTKVAKQSVILKLGKKEVGIIRVKETFGNSIEEQYPLGSELKVRILRYHLSDYAYLCSDAEDVVQQKYFDLNDLSLGEYVDAVVEEVHDKFVAITVGKLKGRIPELHVSDYGILNEETKPGKKITESLLKKKFKPGQKLQARVLKLNPASSIFHVTVKPSFMDPNTPILTKIQDAEIGKQYKGVVVSYLKFGILIGFFGEMKAFVHISQMSHQFITDIPSVFFLGQVVNCTIISINDTKIDASLIKRPQDFQQNGEQSSLNDTAGTKSNKKSKKRKAENSNDEDVSTPKKADKLEKIKPDESSKKKDKKTKAVSQAEDLKEDTVIEKGKNKKVKDNNKKEDKNTIINEVSLNTEKIQLKNDKVKEKKNKIKDIETPIVDKTKIKDKKAIAEDKPSKKKKHEDLENSAVDEVENKRKKTKKCDDINKPSKQEKVTQKIKHVDVANNKQPQDGGLKFSSMSNFFELGASTIVKNVTKDNQSSSSDSEEEKEEEKSKKKRKKLSAAEKVEKARQEEERLRAIEKELADGNAQPKSSDQFERLLLANPNSSELWIAYMAFHLQATEIERARSIGQKALKTISFREEQDKLNVWLALLNLENRFGTQDSLSSTLQQALQMNDSFSVHSKMLDMYLDTGKEQDVLSLVDLMVSKYRNNPQTYIVTGDACFKINAVEKARSVMQKAVNRLEYKTHVPVLIKFAQMENSRGDSERAEALFEQIIGCLPQRVDIWCVYVDMLIKSRKIDSIRLVLERAVSQKLPLKKMKLLYRKWVEIEEKLGDAEQVERVRRMALDFINKIKS